ncbi:YcxB family protein [Streptomyces sp. NBC_01304]|uniref:YcxB family protein n=1 Tax=Streptomyces sp. NBC_01304 TaxID=2903818 RepID=UPI002E129CA1|nr:YcxB family protein [Streptomyces sp. NBC_01304]
MSDQGRDTATDAVELVYRPRRKDVLAGIGARDRLRKLTFVKWAFVAAFALLGLLAVLADKPSAISIGTAFLCAAVIWSIPYLQAHQVIRTVEWQGEYRATVTAEGITVATDHCTLTQRWSMFRGYRELRDHFVLFSRDRSILVVEVLPKRGLRTPEDLDRLRALLANPDRP